MFHRLWTLIRKELQSLLREPQTRAILILPVLIQVILFPFAATLEVTNATIAIYDEDNGEHSVELTHHDGHRRDSHLAGGGARMGTRHHGGSALYGDYPHGAAAV